MSLRRHSAPTQRSTLQVPGFLEAISKSDLFSVCPEVLRRELQDHFHFRPFSRGDVIIREGDRSSSLFVILKGQVQVLSDKYEAVLTELGPGMFFGEIGALFGVKRTANVIAKTSGSLATISRDALKGVLGENQTLWSHLKGVAESRYKMTMRNQRHIPKSSSEKEAMILLSEDFTSIPICFVKDLAKMAEVEEFFSDEIIDFFSPRTRRVIYLVAEGYVQLHTLDGQLETLTKGRTFASYDGCLDFAKALVEKTELIIIDAEQASAIFSECEDMAVQEAGAKLLRTTDLNSSLDTNTSLTYGLIQAGPMLSNIVNPAQFSHRRRNTCPVFSDVGHVNYRDFVGPQPSVPQEVAQTPKSLVNTDDDLKILLLETGLDVSDKVTLYVDGRLNLTPIKNFLNDSQLLAILRVMGDQVKVLNLSGCHKLSSRGILAAWLNCPNLEKVSLQDCWNLDDLALSTVTRSKCAESLKELNICNCWRITTKGLEQIGALQLTKLDLSYCKGLDDKTWPALVQFASTLRSLRLRRCLGVTDASVEGIFGITFPELEFLDLGECPFLTDASISAILPLAPRLLTLNLSMCTALRGTFLLHHQSLPKLQVIDLSREQELVDSEFLNRVVEAFPDLREIYLDGCSKIDDDAMSSATSRLLKLQRISARDCPQLSRSILEVIQLKYD